MSTPSPEKDSLLGPTVHKKIAYQILKMEFFFGSPFNIIKGASKTTKLLDFLHFNLTNPMVPNLANVFYQVGSQRKFREELTRRKWLFYRILTFSPKF